MRLPLPVRISMRFAALAAALLLVACTGSEFGAYDVGSPAPPAWGPGRGASLEILLKDGPIDGLDAVVVTIESIELHKTGGPFFTVLDEPKTFDLLKLRTRTFRIARLDLDAGKYTQIRLIVSAGEVTVDGETHPLEIPSGEVKIIKPFTIPEGALGVMVLDFDAEESIHIVETGGGRYILRPVVKIEELRFFTEEDCPAADPTAPADGATDVAVDTAVTATFPDGTEMPDDPSGLITVVSEDGTEVAGTVTVDGTTATFTPDAPLEAGKKYTVTVHRNELPGYKFCPRTETSFTTAA